jgi:hypothetical protein
MSAASLFILNGLDARVHTPALVVGLVLELLVFALAIYLATVAYKDRPVPDAFKWLVGLLAAFYLVAAAAGALAGGKYAVAAMLAALIPLSAVLVLMATVRAKTVTGQDGGAVETTRRASRDPFPGIGADDETPLGDTTEHSDAERVAQPDPRLRRGR